MQKKKRYGIFHIKDAKTSIISFDAETFDILTGTAVFLFKDEYGGVVLVHHLEPGHYIMTV